MKFVDKNPGEYMLTIEEKIRECVSAIYGYGTDNDGEKIAGIIVEKPIENKELYIGIDTKSNWEAAYDPIYGIEKIFLNMNFIKIKKTMNFYFDLKDHYSIGSMYDWLRLIIKNNGKMAICDGILPSIMVEGVPLDIPTLILTAKGK